jgi:hypothetical protein
MAAKPLSIKTILPSEERIWQRTSVVRSNTVDKISAKRFLKKFINHENRCLNAPRMSNINLFDFLF